MKCWHKETFRYSTTLSYGKTRLQCLKCLDRILPSEVGYYSPNGAMHMGRPVYIKVKPHGA